MIKNILIQFVLIFNSFYYSYGQVNQEDGSFYYYNGEKISLQVNRSQLLVYYQTSLEEGSSIFKKYDIIQEIDHTQISQVLIFNQK